MAARHFRHVVCHLDHVSCCRTGRLPIFAHHRPPDRRRAGARDIPWFSKRCGLRSILGRPQAVGNNGQCLTSLYGADDFTDWTNSRSPRRSQTKERNMRSVVGLRKFAPASAAIDGALDGYREISSFKEHHRGARRARQCPSCHFKSNCKQAECSLLQRTPRQISFADVDGKCE